MLVNKLGVDVLLLMLCRLCFCKSFQSKNYVYCDLNNNALDFLSSFIEIVFKLCTCAGRLSTISLCYQVDY